MSVEDINLANKIMMRGGEHFTTLHMHGKYTEKFVGSGILNELSTKLPSIETVSICHREDDAILRTFGNRLKKLTLFRPRSQEMLWAIPAYCKNLRQLKLQDLYDINLEEVNIWKNIGSTLKVLDFTKYYAQEEIGKIEKWCRRRKKIYINSAPEQATAVSKCLDSYKDQLEYATIDFNGLLAVNLATSDVNAKVGCAAQVAQQALSSCDVVNGRVLHISTEQRNSEGNLWSRVSSMVEE